MDNPIFFTGIKTLLVNGAYDALDLLPVSDGTIIVVAEDGVELWGSEQDFLEADYSTRGRIAFESLDEALSPNFPANTAQYVGRIQTTRYGSVAVYMDGGFYVTRLQGDTAILCNGGELRVSPEYFTLCQQAQ